MFMPSDVVEKCCLRFSETQSNKTCPLDLILKTQMQNLSFHIDLIMFLLNNANKLSKFLFVSVCFGGCADLN